MKKIDPEIFNDIVRRKDFDALLKLCQPFVRVGGERGGKPTGLSKQELKRNRQQRWRDGVKKKKELMDKKNP